MRIFPVVSANDSRSVPSNLTHHLRSRLFRQPYAPVGKFEVVAHREPQLASAGLGFAAANLSRASSSHLSTSHVQHAHPIPQRNKLQQRSAATELDIIRVRSYRQCINPHFIAHLVFLFGEVKGERAGSSTNRWSVVSCRWGDHWSLETPIH